jgi:hypothetical protein
VLRKKDSKPDWKDPGKKMLCNKKSMEKEGIKN